MAEPGFVAALRDPRAFPHPCSHVRLIETHISWVFLTGEYAYKLKKTLDLGFFDFGTLEKRRHYCEEECRCNSAFAPELYLGVVAVRLAHDDRYHIGGAGRVVEYAVKMRQFDDRKQLDRVLERNALTPAMLKRFARSLAAIYAALPPVPRYTGSAGADRILAPMLENFLVLEGVAQARPYAPGLTRVRDWTAAMHERLRARFEERAVAGCIRERHGDLHLSNLVDTDEGIRAFDCVEFNPELRMIDAISDIAFLFMDCSVRGRQDLAYSFLDSYLEATADYPGACLLRFYAVYRSMVRAKVAALRLGQAFDQPTQRRLERHITWAGRTISAVAPTVVLMCGPSGSGKSWLAERLASLLPGIRIRSDIVRRERAPGSPPGKGTYTTAATEAVYTRLLALMRELADVGEAVIVDATFLSAAKRAEFQGSAAAGGYECVVVQCEAPVHCLERRIAQRLASKADPSEATSEVLHRQLEFFEPPRLDERTIRVETDREIDLADLVAKITGGA